MEEKVIREMNSGITNTSRVLPLMILMMKQKIRMIMKNPKA